MNTEELTKLKSMIDEYYTHYNKWSKRWSVIYQSSLYISAAASAIAALILKLDFMKGIQFQTDLSAILAGFAAILTTIAVSGRFDKKWRVNRASRSALKELKIDLSNNVNSDDIRKRLKEIIRKQDEGISGPIE